MCNTEEVRALRKLGREARGRGSTSLLRVNLGRSIDLVLAVLYLAHAGSVEAFLVTTSLKCRA